jgi:hypothetical protein
MDIWWLCVVKLGVDTRQFMISKNIMEYRSRRVGVGGW